LTARVTACMHNDAMSSLDDRGREVAPEGESDVAAESDRATEQPRLYKVLLLNDDYTTMDFVVKVLMDVFHHPEDKAIEIMLSVHQNGVGLAGVYTHEVAETKAAKVTALARQSEFPLRCVLEPA
jgi:ATP-dependent Clp protease adaptor protein ClpS